MKALRCVSGERPGNSFAEDVEGQATHVFGSPEAFIGINTCGVHYSPIIGSLEQFKSSWRPYINVYPFSRLSTATVAYSGFMLSRNLAHTILKKWWLSQHICVRNSAIFNCGFLTYTTIVRFTSPNWLLNLIGQKVMNVNNISSFASPSPRPQFLAVKTYWRKLMITWITYSF